jgi:hypothetical protein
LEDGVRKTVAFVILCMATVLFAADNYRPLNVKPGLWHVTGSKQFMGNAINTDYKTCVRAKDLRSNPWVSGPEEQCTWTVVTSTASDTEIKGTSCALGKESGMDTSIDLKLHAVDSENVKASMQGRSTGNGQTMTLNGTFTGKWVSSSCPADAE